MISNKKILVICQHFWPESFRINDICEFLVEEKGCELEVLCGIPNYPTGKFYDGYSYFHNRKQLHNCMSVHRAFEIPRGNNTNLQIFLNYVSFPVTSLFHIPRLLTKHYDKIFIYQTSPVMMSISGIIVGKLRKIETTMYVLDLWPENLFSVLNIKSPPLRKLATNISHWHYRHVDKLIVLSEKMKDRLIEITHIAPSKIIVLPQACEKLYETDVYDKNLEDRFKNKFNVVYTGNISPAQSFETIIGAAKMLKKNGLANINWVIVGDGMSRKWLENEVRKADLTSNFVFEGNKPVEDIPKYTTVSNLLIGCLVKSDLLEATIPAKVMSYLAVGKPIVLAMDGEVQDLINKQIKCGFAGPAADTIALYKNIKKVYALSDNDRKKMGNRGRDYHFKHFERNIIINRIYNFIFE